MNHIQEYWTESSENYSNAIDREYLGDEHEAWKKFILSEIGEGELNILDIGTGPGFFPLILSSDKRKVTGIDLTEAMVEQAREKLKKNNVNAQILAMDCQNTTFEDETFDVIICRNLVWTLSDPEKAYKEWYRLLKKGGRLLVFDGLWYGYIFFADLKKQHEERKAYVEEKYNAKVTPYGDPIEFKRDFDLMKTLFLSDKRRPDWDRQYLTELGYTVEKIKDEYLDEIIGREERDKRGNISPLFFIKAKK